MGYLAKIEPLVGTVDGVNTVFTTPGGEAYIDGGNVVFLRGLPRVMAWDDGWANTDPANGVVTLKEPPLTGDDVQMLYAVQVVGVETEVTEISGHIIADDLVDGALGAVEELDGDTVFIEALDGSLASTSEITGALDATAGISGTIEVCS